MRNGIRWCGAVAAVFAAAAVLGAAPVGAHRSGGNANLVTDTVYDGVFAESQYAAGWSDNTFQFEVSAAARIKFDPIGPECAPTEAFPPSTAEVSDDAFTSYTAPGEDYKVTLKGHFEPGGVAKGTGLLVTETIEGKSCVELDDWRAHALPKGTVLCPEVDSSLATHTTATGVTCAAAETAYDAGLAEMKKEHPGGGDTAFESPGWDCGGGEGDPIVSATCSRGKEVFRLPAA